MMMPEMDTSALALHFVCPSRLTVQDREIRDHLYGRIATVSRVPDGECMGGTWLITWNNDTLDWGPVWRTSILAAYCTALAYVYELEASGQKKQGSVQR
jgi:hypothetical protein